MTPEIQEAEGALKAAREREAKVRAESAEAITLANANIDRAADDTARAVARLRGLYEGQFSALEARRRRALGEGDLNEAIEAAYQPPPDPEPEPLAHPLYGGHAYNNGHGYHVPGEITVESNPA